MGQLAAPFPQHPPPREFTIATKEDAARLLELFLDYEQQWESVVKTQVRDLSFSLDSEHYADDFGNDKQPSRVKPKGRQLFGNLIHQAAQISRSEIHLDVIPENDTTAPQIAEAVKGLMQGFIYNARKRYADYRDMTALGGLAGGMWAHTVDWDPGCGGLHLRSVAGSNLRWTPGFWTAHDDACPCFYEIVRMRTDSIPKKKGWKNTADLKGDNGGEGGTSSSNVSPGQVDLNASTNERALKESTETRYTTVVFLYERDHYSEQKAEDYEEFKDPAQRYMHCMSGDLSGCGWEGDPASELLADGRIPSVEALPEFGGQDPELGNEPPERGGPCPDCGGPTERVEGKSTEYKYTSNNTKWIFAPYEVGKDGEPCRIFSQGPWPHGITTIPYCIFTCNYGLTKVIGQSETSLHFTMQLSSNLVLRLGLEHMMLAKPFWAVPNTAKDWQGNPWMFGADQGYAIYYDPFESPGGAFQPLQAAGLPGAWPTLYGALENDLRSDMGTNDITFGQDQTKDIPVGTVRTLERLKELPVQHKIERYQREESVFFDGALFPMMQATMTQEELTAIKGQDGTIVHAMLKAADTPSMRIRVTADPNAMKGSVEDIDKLIKVFQAQPPIRRALGKALNLPVTMFEQLEKEEIAWMQKMNALNPAGAGAPKDSAGAAPAGRNDVSERRSPNGAPTPALEQRGEFVGP